MDHLYSDLFFLVFVSAALLSAAALFTRQPLIIAYIAAGIILGPQATGLIADVNAIQGMSHIGIVFLLFLLGLDMQPRSLVSVASSASVIVIVSSCVFFGLGYFLGTVFNYAVIECLVLGMAAMFSSTIIGIKLLPTTVLHHRRAGELMVGLLLLQDLIAICCLIALNAIAKEDFNPKSLLFSALSLPAIIALAFLGVRFVLLPLLAKFDRFLEFIFILAIAWCMGFAKLADFAGLSGEVGAFIAGIALAQSPIAQYIALSLKPLRDFFLVLFFFGLGATLQIDLLQQVWIHVLAYVFVLMAAKPIVFYLLLRRSRNESKIALDISLRLGQISEFSLIVVFFAFSQLLISQEAATLVQSATILSFVVSSYIVILKLPNPIAVSEALRRD